MLKTIASLLTVATLTAVLASPSPARAEIEYPWCLQTSEGSGGITNCGFVTRAQCLATLSGLHGTCYPNPRYSPPAKRGTKPPR